MGKVLVRFTTIGVAIYLIIAYLIAQLYGVDILTNTYTLLFELIVVVYAHSEGRYHCKYLKYTITSIFISECIARFDYLINFLSVSEHNTLPIVIIVCGIGMTTYKAIRHFIQVTKLNNKRKGYGRNLNRKTNREYE